MHTRPGLLFSVLAIAACGGSQPAPAPVTTAEPPPARPAPVTCDEAAVILTPEGGGAEARTADLAQACKDDTWSAEILTCVGSSHRPAECLAKLPDYADLAQLMNVGNDDEDAGDPAPPLECDQVISTVWWYPPELTETSPERRWDLDVRRRTLVEACEHDGWSDELKRCLQTATDENRPGKACLDDVDAASLDDIKKKITAIDELAAAIEKVKKKPASIGCKQVVAAHYADAKWKDKLDGFKQSERKRMIAESRAKMTKACTDTAWSETLRGCIVAGGGETCFVAASMGLTWSYPAAGVTAALGIPECDDYVAQMAKVIACDKLPQSSRDALKQSSDELFAQVLGRPKGERASFASSCKAGAEAIVQALSSLGC
ncbi:MAG: hypothetical protein HOV81_00565 [Kofleriaceae bacterium]|nr:hypothetical protein [Kofleriaceae bacterium]